MILFLDMNTKTLEKLHSFASDLAEIISRCQLAPGKSLRWTIIANPSAGGFTIKRRWKQHKEALQLTREKVQKNPQRMDAVPSTYSREKFGLIPTLAAGHARTITKELLKEMAEDNHSFYLFITAGGDGTSLEVLQTLFYAPPELLSRYVILRLPMGTGNDGAEAFTMVDALELLVNPVHIVHKSGLKLSTATKKTWPGGEPLMAFNILSLGLDAFVTHMTNKMKGIFPGDSYKLWVDIAALFYDRIYKTDFMEVRGYEKNRKVMDFREKLLLCAMGESGYRYYGSHKPVLPDNRNVCVMKQMSLFRKLILKELMLSGAHINTPEAILFNASRLEISGLLPVMAQMDGEAIRLEPEDFPVTIELTNPVIPVLKQN